MILDQQRTYRSYKINRVPGHFSAAPDGVEVSTYTFHTVFESYENSWGTMVTLQTPGNSVEKETSLLISSCFL